MGLCCEHREPRISESKLAELHPGEDEVFQPKQEPGTWENGADSRFRKIRRIYHTSFTSGFTGLFDAW